MFSFYSDAYREFFCSFFENAKKIVEDGGYDAAYCDQVTYYHDPSTEFFYDYPLNKKTGKPILFDIRDPDRKIPTTLLGQ